MNFRLFAPLIVIVAAILGLPSAAVAQVYRPPAGPTITPYLDYFNAPISPLMDNYHTYVRPRAELRSSLSRPPEPVASPPASCPAVCLAQPCAGSSTAPVTGLDASRRIGGRGSTGD